MSHEEVIIDPNDTGDPDASSIAYVGVVGVLQVIAVILAVAALYHAFDNYEYSTKVLNADIKELKVAQAQQKMNLTGGPTWADDKKSTVHINIDRAIGIAAAELDKAKATTAPAPTAGVAH